MKITSDRLIKIMKARGLRVTPQRLAIAEALSKLSHPTAEEIMRAVEKEHPYIGLATIYRALKLFTKTGIIRELSFSEGASRYDMNTPHINAICVRCGRIEDVDMMSDVEKLVKRISKRGYKVLGYRFEVSICCTSCSRLK